MLSLSTNFFENVGVRGVPEGLSKEILLEIYFIKGRTNQPECRAVFRRDPG